MQHRRTGLERGYRIDDCGKRLVFDRDEIGRILGEVSIGRCHEGDWLAGVADPFGDDDAMIDPDKLGRLYGREETATMLKHTGFYPVTPVLYQSFTWEGVLRRMIRWAGLARGLARVARVLFPAQVFAASTLCCVAEKLEAM